MAGIKKEYTNGEITVVWQPEKCIHSGICAKGLPQVFKPKEKPWINPGNAGTDDLRRQIDECPSGAISYYMNDGSMSDKNISTEKNLTEIKVVEKGPFVVTTGCKIIHKDGREEMREKKVSLCRCGASANKPFCDGSHRDSDFDD